MKTQVSTTPAEEAGAYISKKLSLNNEKNILLLLSGGSALSLLDHIDTSYFGPNITIGLTDDRFTMNQNGNTFLHIQGTDFYTDVSEKGTQFIVSAPRPKEGHHNYTRRIKESFEQFYKANPINYTIGIFGIGDDGHTASIFPRSENNFMEIYRGDDVYIPIEQNGNEFPLRGTVTPIFIEEYLDDIVLFAVGSNKCDNILNYMYNHNFAEYQIPALIPASHPQSVLFTDCKTLIPLP